MKKIMLIGATGSIGRNTIHVAQNSKTLKISALAAKKNYKQLILLAKKTKCNNLYISDKTAYEKLAKIAKGKFKIFSGEDGIIELFKITKPDLVVCANTGIETLKTINQILQTGTKIAVANKEIIVSAGEILFNTAEKCGAQIIPIDSEHCAVFQCICGHQISSVQRVILTASGGPFRTASLAKIAKANVQSALLHPVWNMGIKNTIDSATLMNKALEIIEAKHFFKLLPEQISVIIHPQSVIHSIVEFIDGSMLAQMSPPDMKYPIHYALHYPSREKINFSKPFDFAKFANLSFELPDRKKFPSIDFAYYAMKCGGTMPAVMNAANEIAVEKFISGEINIPQIWRIIEKTMSKHKIISKPDINDVIAADKEARIIAQNIYSPRKVSGHE